MATDGMRFDEVLLISPRFVKDLTNISDNVSDKLMKPSILEAQEFGLRGILGDDLIDHIKELVYDGSIGLPAYAPYKSLLDKAQYYLAYSVVSNVCMLTSVKIDNAGLSRVSDENMEPVDMGEVGLLRDFYMHKADYYCELLQHFILQHRIDYPELKQKKLHSIKRNLISSASCGIWLGGRRGTRTGTFRNRAPLHERYELDF